MSAFNIDRSDFVETAASTSRKFYLHIWLLPRKNCMGKKEEIIVESKLSSMYWQQFWLGAQRFWAIVNDDDTETQNRFIITSQLGCQVCQFFPLYRRHSTTTFGPEVKKNNKTKQQQNRGNFSSVNQKAVNSYPKFGWIFWSKSTVLLLSSTLFPSGKKEMK